MDFANELKSIRLAAGLTQKALAEKLGTTPQNINQYETGKRNPRPETIKRIADALNASYGYLKNGDVHFYLFKDTVDPNVFAGEGNPIKDYYLDKTILEHFHNLNEKGQLKAIDQVEMLSKIPEFKKD